MFNLTMAEQLLYSTMKISGLSNGHIVSNGTGFFMGFSQVHNDYVPVLITNKHVVVGFDSLIIRLHLLTDEGNPSSQFFNCNLSVEDGGRVDHPDPSIDLCAIPLTSIFEDAQKRGLRIFSPMIPMRLIPTKKAWADFDAIEDVTMVGCPNGITDEINNLPILRRGITASHIGKDYNGKNEFLVDMACFPGSSGSPLFIFNQTGYCERNGDMNFNSRLFLVGVLYAGPMTTNEGNIVFSRLPQVFVPSPMHLGCVIRSTAIWELEEYFTKRYSIKDVKPEAISNGPFGGRHYPSASG